MQKDNLDISKYPEIYREYLEKETAFVKKYAEGAYMLLDVGCGTGRMIPILSPIVGTYVGIDNNLEYLEQAEEVAANSEYEENTRIILLDAEKLSKEFSEKEFDVAICLWNTLACVKNDKKVIHEISKVAKKCILSINAKGSLAKRKQYYDSLGLGYTVDEQTETIYSEQWGQTRAYSKEEINVLLRETDFTIQTIELVNDLAYLVHLKS